MNDLEQPNLFIGKLIGDSYLKGEVVSFDETTLQIKVTHVNNKYFERYVDVGHTYPLCVLHRDEKMLIWEVQPEAMKRQVSQILLQWEKDIGWTWDLDS